MKTKEKSLIFSILFSCPNQFPWCSTISFPIKLHFPLEFTIKPLASFIKNSPCTLSKLEAAKRREKKGSLASWDWLTKRLVPNFISLSLYSMLGVWIKWEIVKIETNLCMQHYPKFLAAMILKMDWMNFHGVKVCRDGNEWEFIY